MIDEMSGDQPLAIITGAGRGIGEALAHRFAADGYRLLLIDLDRGVETVAAGLSAAAAVLDVTDEQAVSVLAATVPSCSALINNAAITYYESLLETSAASARRVLDVNVVAPLLMSRLFAPALQAGGPGAIVNLSSITAAYHPPSTGVYSTSKAAIEALTRAIAVEFGPLGIRCNAVAPGTIPTEGSAGHYGDDEAMRRRGAVLPLGRVGSTGDICDAISFLVSPRASYITGQVIAVDGGHTVAGGHFYRLARQAK